MSIDNSASEYAISLEMCLILTFRKVASICNGLLKTVTHADGIFNRGLFLLSRLIIELSSSITSLQSHAELDIFESTFSVLTIQRDHVEISNGLSKTMTLIDGETHQSISA